MTPQDFAKAMQTELNANADKGGWQDMSAFLLLCRAQGELRELEGAVLMDETPERVLSEAADTANYLMMLADNYRTRWEKENGVPVVPEVTKDDVDKAFEFLRENAVPKTWDDYNRRWRVFPGGVVKEIKNCCSCHVEYLGPGQFCERCDPL